MSHGDAAGLVVIAGPTAVGKTAVSMALARRIPAEIVCADSRALYRGMDIGTAKPSREDREAIPHHLLDVADPDQVVTLAGYQDLARAAIADIRGRGRVPLLVGGTGLYIRAVVDRLAIPPVPPDWALRARLERVEREGGPGTLHRRLAAIDPAAASRIHPRNVRRIVRALEVHERTGTVISALRESAGGGEPAERGGAGGAVAARETGGTAPGNGGGEAGAHGAAAGVRMVALTLDRARLYERIDRRIRQQLAAGLVDEARALLRAGYARALPALYGLGYKEIIAYLDGALSLEEAAARFRRNTRRYAKRQWTWFRADARYRWIDVADAPPEVVAARIRDMMAL